MRLPSLTGLRFLAAMGVFVYHTRSLLPGWWGWTTPFFAAGQAGVSFFFILSGFVLTWSAPPGDRPRAFWRRRCARILPAYLLTWLIGIPVTLAWFGAWPGTDALLATATLSQSWFDDKSLFFGVNGVAWSLSCEAFFYAVFPLALRVLVGRDARHLGLGMAGCVGVLAAVQLAGWRAGGADIADPSTTAFWLVSVLPVSRLPEFLLGMLAARAVISGRPPRMRLRWTAPVALGALYLAGTLPTPVVAGWLTALPFTALICAAAANDLDGTARFLRTDVLVRLGTWSFAFYLSHQLVIRLVAWLWPAAVWPVLQVAVDLILTVAVSAVLYHRVERPAQRRLREPV